MTTSPQPTTANLEQVARFLAFFDRARPTLGSWCTRDGVLPTFDYSVEMCDFIAALHEHHFIIAFDRKSWSEEARNFFADHTLVANATLDDVQRIFTIVIRGDRFAEGSLIRHVETGMLRALLKRVASIAIEDR